MYLIRTPFKLITDYGALETIYLQKSKPSARIGEYKVIYNMSIKSFYKRDSANPADILSRMPPPDEYVMSCASLSAQSHDTGRSSSINSLFLQTVTIAIKRDNWSDDPLVAPSTICRTDTDKIM